MDFVQHRAGTLFLLFFVLLVLACSRTMYLDVFRGATLRKAGTAEHLTEEVVSPRRGAITDRDGVELAVSEPAQDLSADPFLVHDPDALSKRLAPLLGQSSSSILEKLSEQRGFVYLARALPEAQAEAVLNLKVPGINGTPVMRRVYPRGTLAAQLLGFVGTEGQGLSGLEYADNRLLAGSAGKRKVVSDALGQPLSISESHPEQPGTGISLTLDSNIQARAEQVLAAVGRVFEPKDATAIVMNPRDGELLAVANWPQINANDPSASPSSALEDRAVSFDYEPGSTFKIVTIGGSLQEGLITPQSGFVVPDQIQVADRTIHDDTEHATESLTVSEILARSSNVGTIEIGKLLGAEAFNGWAHRFGFGTPAGAGMAGEEQGLVLPLSQYSGSSMGNLPIGQGELVTPMQMVTAYAAVANGGILRPPRIVGSIGGKAVPEPAGRRVISSTTATSLRHMLEGVLGPDGTASQVSIPGYQLAGKTGTASKIDPETGEYSHSAYVASFIGFAPATDPKLLCAVVVDEPQSGSIFGGAVAAPAFGQIMSFALPYMNIPPS